MSQKVSILRTLYQFTMVFGFVSRLTLGPISSMRLVMLISILVVIYRWKQAKMIIQGINRDRLRKSFLLLLVALFVTMAHVPNRPSGINEYFEPIEIVTTVIGIFFMGFWSVLEIKHSDRFMKILAAVGVIQSLSVFLSFNYPPFQSFVINNFMTNEFLNKVEEANIIDRVRIPGLGIAWSSGSLILAFCALQLVALRVRNVIDTLLFALLYALIMGATALMGRSGLIVELIFLLYYGVSVGNIRSIMGIIMVGLIGLFALRYLLAFIDPMIAEATERWIFAFLDKDSVMLTNEGISKGGFPPFSSDFIFGTGVRYGSYGGYGFYADSGYIKTYTSIGIIGMVGYYGGIVLLMCSTLMHSFPSTMKRLLLVAIGALLLMEYKEPFINMFIYPWIIFTMGLTCISDYSSDTEYYI